MKAETKQVIVSGRYGNRCMFGTQAGMSKGGHCGRMVGRGECYCADHAGVEIYREVSGVQLAWRSVRYHGLRLVLVVGLWGEELVGLGRQGWVTRLACRVGLAHLDLTDVVVMQ